MRSFQETTDQSRSSDCNDSESCLDFANSQAFAYNDSPHHSGYSSTTFPVSPQKSIDGFKLGPVPTHAMVSPVFSRIGVIFQNAKHNKPTSIATVCVRPNSGIGEDSRTAIRLSLTPDRPANANLPAQFARVAVRLHGGMQMNSTPRTIRAGFFSRVESTPAINHPVPDHPPREMRSKNDTSRSSLPDRLA